MLVRGQFQALFPQVRLQFLCICLEFGVCGEIDRLVCRLAESSEGNPPVKGGKAFLPNDSVGSVCSIAVSVVVVEN